MQEIPTIEKQETNGDSVHLYFKVTDAIKWFTGHFPGKPILPGVVQIDWAVYFAHKYFELPDGFMCMEKIKFQNLIVPDQKLHLILKKKPDNTRFSFQYKCNDKSFSSGILNLSKPS